MLPDSFVRRVHADALSADLQLSLLDREAAWHASAAAAAAAPPPPPEPRRTSQKCHRCHEGTCGVHSHKDAGWKGTIVLCVDSAEVPSAQVPHRSGAAPGRQGDAAAAQVTHRTGTGPSSGADVPTPQVAHIDPGGWGRRAPSPADASRQGSGTGSSWTAVQNPAAHVQSFSTWATASPATPPKRRQRSPAAENPSPAAERV